MLSPFCKEETAGQLSSWWQECVMAVLHITWWTRKGQHTLEDPFPVTYLLQLNPT